MWRDPWPVLGISPTGDQTEIRRAYARRLKVTNPEDDAEAFQALREAYERALSVAQHWRPEDDDQDEDDAYDDAYDGEEYDLDSIAPDAEITIDGPPSAPVAEGTPSSWNPPAPAGPWGAAQDVGDHVSGDELAHLNRTLAALAEVVQASEVDRDAARQALRAVLESPAMDSMEIREQAEQRIAAMILNSGVGGAVLIDPSARAFGWEGDRLGSASPWGAAVLERRQDLSFMWSARSSASDSHGAWKALTEKPVGARLWWNRLTLGLPAQVRNMLERIYGEHRSLIGELDPDALAWWRQRLDAPWFGPAMVWTAVVAPLILTPMLAATNLFGEEDRRAFALAYPAALVGVLALLMSALGLGRLQGIWRESRGYVAPAWEVLGWAPLSLAAMAGAALAPQAAWAAGAVGVVAAVWSILVAEPRYRTEMESVVWSFPARWFPYIQFPFNAPTWLVRTFGLVTLAFFWICLAETTAPSAWPGIGAVVAPAVAAGVAFIAGHDRLESAWRELSRRVRITACALGALGLAGLPYWLWSTAPDASLGAIGFVVVSAAVLAERIVSLGSPGILLRDQIYHLGWLPAAIIAGLAEEGPSRHGNAALLFVGAWLLAGAAAGLIGELRRERWTRPAYA